MDVKNFLIKMGVFSKMIHTFDCNVSQYLTTNVNLTDDLKTSKIDKR